MFMEDGIKFEAKFGDGSEAKQGFFKSKIREPKNSIELRSQLRPWYLTIQY